MRFLYLVIIFYTVILSAWWISFNTYCSYRFDYCHNIQPSNECGVSFSDSWEFNIQDILINFVLSFVRCEGVIE
jgi:hypothetical protein